VLRNWRIVKIATTKAQRKLFFNLRRAKKELSWLSNDEVNAVAADLGVDVAEVRRMEGRLSSVDVGFDADTDDERGPVAPVHYLEDRSADPALLLESDNQEESNHQHLSVALADLDERSRDILQSRWLTDNKATLHDLAARYSVSAERIRQLEQAAMKKLRAVMEA
jgi:RNA polymerase sigma-32 factor